MRKAIVYASVHHGNTEKIVKSIAERCQVDLIDAVKQSDVPAVQEMLVSVEKRRIQLNYRMN